MKRVMILLERIVLALKQLVNKANPCVPVTETSQSSPATEENVGDLRSDIYPPPVTDTLKAVLSPKRTLEIPGQMPVRHPPQPCSLSSTLGNLDQGSDRRRLL
jgi:hypothetical protein